MIGTAGRVGGGRRARGNLLDRIDVPVIAAWSLRRLSSAYAGPALRVRRSSDNAELDIGFSGHALDQSALLGFVGAGDGFVTTWYDQSGAGLSLTQAVAANQPRIVITGAYLAGIRASSGTVERLTVSNSAFAWSSAEMSVASVLGATEPGAVTGGVVWALGNTTTSGARLLMLTDAGSRNLRLRISSVNRVPAPELPAAPPGNVIVVTKSSAADASAVTVRLNGGSPATFTAEAIGAGATIFGINQGASSGLTAPHLHREHIVVGRALTAGEAQAVAADQMQNHGVTP